MKNTKSFFLSIMAVCAIFFSLSTDIVSANEGDVGLPHVSPDNENLDKDF